MERRESDGLAADSRDVMVGPMAFTGNAILLIAELV